MAILFNKVKNFFTKGIVLNILKVLLLSALCTELLFSLDYNQKDEVKKFIDKMDKEFNYNKAYLQKLFKYVKKNPYVISKKITKNRKKLSIKSGTKKHKPQGKWEIYARLHLENNQTALGVKFMHKHQKIFQKAYKKYGVAPEYITAIIGIESYYGKNRGRYYVFDSLAHLAFSKNKRKKFYQYQLQEFLRMCYREQVEPRAVKGSKSGAIGLAQFMPSNYTHYAVDFNNDKKIRISQADDAIGSIANYFKENGWKEDEPVATRVRYKGNRFQTFKTGYEHKYHRKELINIKPRNNFSYKKKVMLIKLEREKYDELWYGTHNFYVITRYNHSNYYAMVVHQLAQKIKKSYLAKYKHSKKKKLYLTNK